MYLKPQETRYPVVSQIRGYDKGDRVVLRIGGHPLPISSHPKPMAKRWRRVESCPEGPLSGTRVLN